MNTALSCLQMVPESKMSDEIQLNYDFHPSREKQKFRKLIFFLTLFVYFLRGRVARNVREMAKQ